MDDNQNQSRKNKAKEMNSSIQNKEPKVLSVRANFIFSLIIQLLTYIIPIFTSPYLSRTLGPTGVGANSFAGSIVSYFTLIIAFGFVTYGTKLISSQRQDKEEYSKTFWNIVFTRSILFALSFVVYFLMAYLWGFGGTIDKNIFLVYSILLIANFLDITYLFQGLENFRVISVINIIFRILNAVAIFIFVKSSDDLLIYILLYVGQSLLVALVSWFFAKSKISRPHLKDIHFGHCLKESFFYFLPTIAISVYTVLDRTMLGYMASTEEVAYYEEAYKIISMVTALINALSPVMLSRISRLYAEGKEGEIRKKMFQMSEVYALIGWPAVMGLYAVSRYFFPAFFGAEYAPSVQVSYFLIPLILIIPISNQIGSAYYVPRDKVAQTTWFFVAGASVNFITNFFAIRYMGAKGAALTSLIAESIISGCFIIFSWKGVNYKDLLKAEIKPIISALVMFAVLMLLNYLVLDKYFDSNVSENANLYKALISVGTGVVVYAVMVLVLREPMVMNVLRNIKGKLIHKKNAY